MHLNTDYKSRMNILLEKELETCNTNLPINPTNWANKIFKIKGNESSIVLVSELNRFSMRPTGVSSKKLNSV